MSVKLPRAWSVDNILTQKYDLVDFSEKWADAFGDECENKGLWFIWGDSGNGKGSFTHQLIKELARNEKVLINELEEGNAKTIQDSFKRVGMAEVRRKVQMVKESMDALQLRLDKPKSQRVVVINSYQYTGMGFRTFLRFIERYPSKLFIVTSQADGKRPTGKPARDAMYHATLKIWVEGFRAFSKGRYFGPNGGVYDIWPERSAEYYGAI